MTENPETVDLEAAGPPSAYDRVLPYCERYQIVGPLSFLPADDNVLCGPRDPEAMWTALKAEFSEEYLTGAGIACRAEDGSLMLAPELSGPDRILVALRISERGHVFDLLTEAGCLSKRQRPVFAVCGDWFADQPQLLEQRDVLVAFTLMDLVIIRALGLRATIASGLEDLDRCGVAAHFWTDGPAPRRV